jgi:hypothetical protein
MPNLTISMVLFQPTVAVVLATLRSLAIAVQTARQSGHLNHVQVTIIDHSPTHYTSQHLAATIKNETYQAFAVHYMTDNTNPGYGAGNNVAILASQAPYHLILNPDVWLERTALQRGIDYLQHHPDVVLVAPSVMTAHHEYDHLCKAYPTIFDLYLRGFAPTWMRNHWQHRLERYTLASVINQAGAHPVTMASGCCMLCSTPALQAIGGFDQRFFLYFEDFDLSLRLQKHGMIMLLSAMRIRHFGGHTAQKGFTHIFWFIRSGIRFFHQHGWRWY